MAEAYSFRLLDYSDLEFERLSALLRLVFPKARHLTPRYLRWQYADNPDGLAVGCNAYRGEELVGHLGMIALPARLDGELRKGLCLLNSAVHPAHRGRKLQTRVAEASVEEGVRRGYDFCLAVGNRYSTGPLLTRKYKLLKPLDARIGFGLPRRIGGNSPASFERVWNDAAKRWRLANPERHYAVAQLDGRALVTAPGVMPGVDAILHDAVGRWPTEGSGPVGKGLRIWLGLDPDIAWGRSTFIPVPSRLRPSPLNLVFKDLSGKNYLPDPDRVTFRAVDFDPY